MAKEKARKGARGGARRREGEGEEARNLMSKDCHLKCATQQHISHRLRPESRPLPMVKLNGVFILCGHESLRPGSVPIWHCQDEMLAKRT